MGLQFTFFNFQKFSRFERLGVAIFLACSLAVFSCGHKEQELPARTDKGGRKWNRPKAELEYRLIKSELALAKTEKPYLVFDFKKGKLKLKMKGAVVWNYPMDIATTDTSQMQEFMNRFEGSDDIFVRPLVAKHLFSAKGKTPDSVLAIVGEAVRVNPDLLQRELPEKFQLLWEDGLILEIKTDISGKPVSNYKNTMIQIRRVLRSPFGESRIILNMQAEDALTLYRVAEPGLQTIIYPPL